MSLRVTTPRLGRFVQAVMTAGDIVIVNILFGLTLWVMPELPVDARTLRELWLLVNIGCLPMIFITHGDPSSKRAILMERVMRNALMAVGTHALFLMSLTSFLAIILPWKMYVFFYGLMLAALPLFQISATFTLKKRRSKGFNFARVVIVGTGANAQRLYENMQKDAGFGYRVLAFFDDEISPGFYGEVLPLNALADFVATKDVQQIFFALTGNHEALLETIKIADDKVAEFYFVPNIPQTLARGFSLGNIGPVPVLSIRRNPLKNIFARMLKRSFDLAVSSTFLLFYPLIYIPVAIAIKISSPGPVYFVQERTGYRGRTFRCLKFRTMRVNAQADRAQATEHDPRKTRVGDFLRRTSLDELPQFINVWKGDMSVVGPRPHMLKHTEDYTRLVDRYMVRHAVKPGITGWAQVNGYRGITDQLWKMERRVEFDVWYIENWTFLLDIKIMIRTVINAIAGEKNAF